MFLPPRKLRQIEQWVKFTKNYETKQRMVSAVNVVQWCRKWTKRTHLVWEERKTESQSSKKILSSLYIPILTILMNLNINFVGINKSVPDLSNPR